MAVYVDDAVWPWRGQLWCHLLADSLDELHQFAQSIGLKKEWFQGHTKYPHYDMNENRRKIAVKKGAIEIDKRTTIEKAKKLKAEFELMKYKEKGA